MQPSLFGVEATEPSPADLAGLLAGPGQLQQMGGTARVRVWVEAGWRVHVLIGELSRRGLPASWAPVHRPPDLASEGPAEGASEGPSEGPAERASEEPADRPPELARAFEVRTAYTTRLGELARRWQDGPPARLHLDGQALRLWAAAGGYPDPEGYLLRLAGGDELRQAAIEAALRAAGLRPTLVPGPAYRITGRRLALLAELVGDPPGIAPADHWPACPP